MDNEKLQVEQARLLAETAVKALEDKKAEEIEKIVADYTEKLKSEK